MHGWITPLNYLTTIKTTPPLFSEAFVEIKTEFCGRAARKELGYKLLFLLYSTLAPGQIINEHELIYYLKT